MAAVAGCPAHVLQRPAASPHATAYADCQAQMYGRIPPTDVRTTAALPQSAGLKAEGVPPVSVAGTAPPLTATTTTTADPAAVTEASDEQQAKRRKMECLQVPEQACPAVEFALDGAGPGADVEMELELLEAQIDALARQMNSVAGAASAQGSGSRTQDTASVPAAAPDAACRKGASPVPPPQDQDPHPSSSSQPSKLGTSATVTAAAQERRPSTRMLKQHEEALAQYARMKAKADAEAARAAAAARASVDKAAAATKGDVATPLSAEWLPACRGSAVGKQLPRQGNSCRQLPLQESQQTAAHAALLSDDYERLQGTPGYVPRWLREWRPKARAARAKEARRKAAETAAAAHQYGTPPARQSDKQGSPQEHQEQLLVKPQQLGQPHNDQLHHHKHLSLMLEALMDNTGAAQADKPDPSTAVAATAAAAAPEASGHLLKQQDSREGVACFVFTANMLPALQPPRPPSTKAEGSRSSSPEVVPGSSSLKPSSEVPAGEPATTGEPATAKQGAGRSREGSREPSSSSRSLLGICSLPKKEWAKLSAAAGLGAGKQSRSQPKQAQPHLAKNSKVPEHSRWTPKLRREYKGVYSTNGSGRFEVRIHRSSMGTVLRFPNHVDAVSAARAHDRAVLCLARAAYGKQRPDLNFPVEDYEGEALPDLTGMTPSEVRDVLQKTFQGPPPTTLSAHTSHASGGSASPLLPAPNALQLQRWLSAGNCAAAGVTAITAIPVRPLKWGSKRPRSSLSPAVRAKQQQPLNAARAGLAALQAAGIAPAAADPAGRPAVAKPHLSGAPRTLVQELQRFNQQQPRQQHVLPTVLPPQGMRQQQQAQVQVKQEVLVPNKPHIGVPAASLQPSGTLPPGSVMQQQLLHGEQVLLSKMRSDLQHLSRHNLGMKQFLQHFRHELTKDPAALEAAAVVSPAGQKAQEQVQHTLLVVEACDKQQQALQQLLADTMQLLQPALTDEARQRLQRNSVALAPAVNALATSLSHVCKSVLAAAVAQDAAACSSAQLASAGGAGAAAGVATGAAAGGSSLAALQQAMAPGLDKIPAGSARAQRMARLSKAIKASQDNMASARKVLSGQA